MTVNRHYNYTFKVVAHELIDKWCNLEALEKRTDRILRLGDRFNAKFTFFVTAENITSGNEHIIEKIVDSGHEIGSHSYNHVSFENIDNQAASAQISRSLRVLNKYYPVKGFRAPYLIANSATEQACAGCGLLYSSSTIGKEAAKHNNMWLVPVTQPMDYEVIQKEGLLDKDEIGRRWMSFPGHGEILLFHPWRLGSKKYISFLEGMLEKKYVFGTIEQFIGDHSLCCITFDLDFLATWQVYPHTIKHLFRSPYLR